MGRHKKKVLQIITVFIAAMLLEGCSTGLANKCVAVDIGPNASFEVAAAALTSIELKGPASYKSAPVGGCGPLPGITKASGIVDIGPNAIADGR